MVFFFRKPAVAALATAPLLPWRSGPHVAGYKQKITHTAAPNFHSTRAVRNANGDLGRGPDLDLERFHRYRGPEPHNYV